MNKQGIPTYSAMWPESVSQYELMQNATLMCPRPRYGQLLPIGSAFRYHRVPMAEFLVRSRGRLIL
jgi:hypothetical protein